MSKFSYNISSVADQNGESEIIMRIYVTRDSRFRIKSGIRLDPKRWGKKNEINIPLVDSPERDELLEKRTKLKALTEYLETEILNMSDGLLGDALKMKFICTFNAPLKDIDKALLRKGRLVARYEFGDLTPEKANKIITAQSLDIPLQTTPISLSELYNYEAPSFVLTRKTVGF